MEVVSSEMVQRSIQNCADQELSELLKEGVGPGEEFELLADESVTSLVFESYERFYRGLALAMD